MKNKKDENISLKETLNLHIRAFLLLRQKNPGMFLSSLLSAVFSAAAPCVELFFSARIIEELAGERDIAVLRKLIVLTVVVSAVLILINAILFRWKDYTEDAIWVNTRKIYADKFYELDFCVMDEQKTHDLRAQVEQNEGWASYGLIMVINLFNSAANAVIGIIGSVALSVGLFVQKVPADAGKWTVLNNSMFIFGLIFVLLLGTALPPLFLSRGDRYHARYAEQATHGNRFFGFFGFMARETERALDIRMYNQQEICSSYFEKDKSFKPGCELAEAAKGPLGGWNALSASVGSVFTGLIYVFVCLKARAGAFGIGGVAQYVGAITTLSKSLSSLLSVLSKMKTNAVFLKTTFEYLDLPNRMYQGTLTTEKRADRSYEIEFKNVSFRYPGSEEFALKNVSFKFRVGERLAVVGRNGSGKTTFIKLLCRLYDPTEGEILLNGIDIKKYRYDDYLQIFSVVFQDFKLLSAPLGENVASRMKYKTYRAEKTLNEAGFSERLKSMPQGLDTYLYKDYENNGVLISGGEAQKIAIARALYKDAPFMILDEPTAALDPIAEAEIYSRFNDIAGDKTAVYISHRLSSCRFCDKIAVFDSGRLVQTGSHEDLLSDAKGIYHKLWYAQAQYYLRENINFKEK
ncbi:MAG: ABC transporter ATP-binding protein [Oscillospiraceae bacterium]|nr:ABC transporter ATP-binding protein [Oscillospiraceae bacterium]